MGLADAGVRRWIPHDADLMAEYARHAGHADLIRESIGGRVGEDGPPP